MEIVKFVATSAFIGFGVFAAAYIVTLMILALSPLPPVSVMVRQKRTVVRWSAAVGVLSALAWLAWGTP